jgi:hypothetical protein
MFTKHIGVPPAFEHQQVRNVQFWYYFKDIRNASGEPPPPPRWSQCWFGHVICPREMYFLWAWRDEPLFSVQSKTYLTILRKLTQFFVLGVETVKLNYITPSIGTTPILCS